MWESIAEILVRLLLEIHSVIYSLISNVYQVFIAIASARIFTADKYQYVANRIYVVIGVAALFFVAYGLLQAIINPESSGKNDKGVNGIVKNLLISIALIAFIPAIFNFAYNIQSSIIGSNVIGKIFLNTPDTSNMGVVYKDGVDPLDEDVTMAGAKLANDIFISFFSPIDANGEPKCIDNDPNAYIDCLNEVKSDEDITLGNTYTNVSKTGKFAEYRKYSANAVGDEKTIEFNWFMQFLVGILLVYVFVSFCIDMGLRTVKLCYYELIAPIPILTMIIPGQKKIFDSWKKNTISTFLDVFIHIAVVFFVLLLIKNLPSLGDPIWNQSLLGEPSNGVKLFARIFIIVGLLMFMKQAPKLFGDLFGVSSGSFKLGIGDKLKEATDFSRVPVIGRAQGAVTGAAGAGWTALWNKGGDVKKGLKTGFYRGLKNKGQQFNVQRQAYYSKELDREGTAGWFGGRNKLEELATKSSREAKDAYKYANFNNVLKFEQSKEWKDIYEKYYNNEINALNDEIKEIGQKITDAVKNKEELDVVKQSYANLSRLFENKKNEKRVQIQKEYENAVFKKDINAQLDAQKRLNELNATKYHNPELENRIKELSSIINNSDSSLDVLNNRLKECNNKKDIVEKEHEYITTGKLQIGDKTFDRSYKTEEEFVKRYGGFTDALTKAQAEFRNTNPNYKDPFDSHKRYMSRINVDQFINSEEGQIAIAVREAAEKNLQSKSSNNSGSSGSDKGSGDKK